MISARDNGNPVLRPPRQFATAGLAAMLIGLGMVVIEFQTGVMQNRLGLPGRMTLLVCGTGISVWGLKEIISRYWPRLAGRGYHMRIPIEGWAYLAILVVMFFGALIGRSNTLMMVFSLMAGPFVVNGWFIMTMLQRVKARRDLPERIMAGETFTVTVTLANDKSWMAVWLMRVQDSVLHVTGSLKPEVLFVHVPPKKERRGHYQLELRHRGQYLFGPFDLTTRFPLGLVERGVLSPAEQELLVYPRPGHLKQNWRAHLQQSVELASHVRPQSGPFNDDLYRIREYRTGDDTRMIHWRTSARMNDLMVCEYKESRDRDLWLIVDPWVPSDPTSAQRELAEVVLRFAVTICLDQLRNSRESSLAVLLIGRKGVRWEGGVGDDHIETLLDDFALFQPDNYEFTGQLIPESQRQGRVLAISTRPEGLKKRLKEIPEYQSMAVQILSADSEELSRIYIDDPVS